tara:strand:+ start:73 stop:291 length:219 start_codon:yes stop_codon:yes gene_type:complete
MKETITKETTIGELVERHPKAAEVLMEYGLHCIGCHVSPFESIEQGFKGHGVDGEKKIAEAVKKINQLIEEG